jgi:hypothetical protein
MTAQEARIIAEQVNRPKIEKWLNEYPISRIIDQIKSASAAGFYGIEYDLPQNTPTFVLMYLLEEFQKMGYVAFYEREEAKNDRVLYKLTLKWE